MDSQHFNKADRALALSSPANFQALGEPTNADGTYTRAAVGDQLYFGTIKSYKPEVYGALAPNWEVTTCLWVSCRFPDPSSQQKTYGIGQFGSPRETAAEQIKHQKHLGGTGYEKALVVPNIASLIVFRC